MTVWLYIAQRATALVMAPLVIGHLVVMIIAVQNGLSAEEILGRTRGSVFWGTFYALFVIAVSIHTAIGLRTIATEVIGRQGRLLDGTAIVVALGLLYLGGRAVVAVVL